MREPSIKPVPSASEAVELLMSGNRRFASRTGLRTGQNWNPEMAEREQRPFAIILGCCDSRVPVEVLFDQGFGDLYVARIAGNVVAPSIVGSIEFAASQFGTQLVVVLGHTNCGAIRATIDAIANKSTASSKAIRDITERISPGVEELVRQQSERNSSEMVRLHRAATRANIRASVNHLKHGSQMLEELVDAGKVAIVGAEFSLETGEVEFFPGALGRKQPAGRRPARQASK